NSQHVYNQLNGLRGFNAYIHKCETLNSVHKSNNVKKICARLLQYLDNYTKSINENDEYDICMLLSFWVYSRLFDILKSKGETYIYRVYAKFQSIWYGFIDDNLKNTNNKKCRPISDLAVYDDWRDRKELYEYCVDYYTFSQTLAGFPDRCKEFYKYVESKKALYAKFKNLCSSDKKKGCPEFYAKCEKYDPEKVLPRLDCYHEIKQERDAAALSIPQLRDEHSVNEPNSEGTDAGMKPFDDPNLSGNPHTVTKLGNVFLGVVATTMTSGALYRFTPLGGMIRNGLGWNTNNMRNFNGGDIRLYDYAAEPFNPYPGEEHYIGYHPA
ncbi:variable surface protein Vir14, truncated, putative, partial [Plasmodium vivax]